MGDKKFLRHVMMFLTFLLVIGIAATSFSAQKTTTQPKPAVQQTAPLLQQGQLPDLTIVDIALNEKCFVVVTAKNNGPGALPDKVWTDHSPESCAIYLYINGKKWGGETIWYFDPDKNLQKPDGKATMTSNLQVTGTATIKAVIDHTQRVKETDEKNNAMKKKVMCQTVTTTQPGQQGQPSGPVRVKAQLGVKPAAYSGNCPALISFRGHITVNQPTTVQYKFIRSDNASAPVQTLTFAKAGTQEVTTTWQLGGPSLPTFSGWQAIEVISPVSVQSNKADFKIRCTGEGQQGGTEPEKQLPDLTIVDITLNEGCFVVVTAKNNGPGKLPDKVWTDHSPDSSAIYLYINGKKWGGKTIWGFDPDKNLQKPGGTATMTSNLKVTGTATIEAVIDHTHKVKETDEKNNVMKKEVTCKTIGTIQPGVVAQPGTIAKPGTVAKPEPSTQPAVGAEDCVSFNPTTTTVQQIQGSWKVVDGSHWMFDFGAKKADADRTLAIIKHYRMNQSCYVGRPNPPFHYMLVSGASPVGSYAGEDCVSFNPATTTVQQIKGNWKVVDGSHWMFDFGAKKAEADQTLAIIKKYGFTYSCYVGRPGPNFTYLRK